MMDSALRCTAVVVADDAVAPVIRATPIVTAEDDDDRTTKFFFFLKSNIFEKFPLY